MVWELMTTIQGRYNQIVNFDFTKYRYRLVNNTVFHNTLLVPTLNTQITLPPNSATEIYSSQITQSIVEVKSVYENDPIYIERLSLWTPPTLKMNIDGAVKEFDKGWVKVDGQLKEIDKMWTKVDGVLKEI